MGLLSVVAVVLSLSMSAAPAQAGRGGKVSCDVNPGNVDCTDRTVPAETKQAPASDKTPSTEKTAPPKSR